MGRKSSVKTARTMSVYRRFGIGWMPTSCSTRALISVDPMLKVVDVHAPQKSQIVPVSSHEIDSDRLSCVEETYWQSCLS